MLHPAQSEGHRSPQPWHATLQGLHTRSRTASQGEVCTVPEGHGLKLAATQGRRNVVVASAITCRQQATKNPPHQRTLTTTCDNNTQIDGLAVHKTHPTRSPTVAGTVLQARVGCDAVQLGCRHRNGCLKVEVGRLNAIDTSKPNLVQSCGMSTHEAPSLREENNKENGAHMRKVSQASYLREWVFISDPNRAGDESKVGAHVVRHAHTRTLYGATGRVQLCKQPKQNNSEIGASSDDQAHVETQKTGIHALLVNCSGHRHTLLNSNAFPSSHSPPIKFPFTPIHQNVPSLGSQPLSRQDTSPYLICIP
jgi:hypothetical protein